MIPLSHHAPIDKFVYTSTKSLDVIFYLIDGRGGIISHPSWQVVAQNATTGAFIDLQEISEAGTFTHLFGNMISVQATSEPAFFIFDGRTVFNYFLNTTSHHIQQASNVQVCSDTNYTFGNHHIQAPSHFTTANLTIDNIISGVCAWDKSLWVVNGNSMTTMSSTTINANCQWLIDGYINLGLLGDQTITALCNDAGTFTSQTGPQSYVVYSYTTNGPTILNGGHIVSQILLQSTSLSASPTPVYDLVTNMDYTHFSFVDVSSLFSAKPLTMEDTCPAGDCPKIFNVWQNFETGGSSAFFKNGIIINFDHTLKGIRVYNTNNSTQLGSRTCGTDCFPVSFSGQPWLSFSDINPNLVYMGSFDSITLWNTTTETAAYYNNTPGSNNPGGSGNNCNTPSFSIVKTYDVDSTSANWNLGQDANYFAGEQFTSSSRYLGDSIHAITYHVHIAVQGDIPSNTLVTFGVFNPDNSTKRTFATLDASNATMFSSGENIFNITLPLNNPYTIASGDILGAKAQNFNDSSGDWHVSLMASTTDQTDGPDSRFAFWASNALNIQPTNDLLAQLYKQTQNPCNAPPTNPTTPGTAFCANPANANILQCRVVGNTTSLNIAPGIQNLISSTGIFNLCSGVFKTNGMGYLVTLILVIIGVGLLWVASNKRGRDIPTFLWVIFAIGIFGFSTAIGCIDPTILIVTIIAIIALGVASTTELLQGATRRLIARE